MIGRANWKSDCPQCVASKFTCDRHYIDQWTHKGWRISFDMPPIPVRSFDWTATSPDYDVDCDQDGFFRCGGDQVHAATYEELLLEIECAIMDREAA